MQIDHLREQCHYGPCTCNVAPGSEYCSDYCRQAAEFSEPDVRDEEVARRGDCGCEHAECAPR